MSKIPLSRLILTLVLFVITAIDVFIAVGDIMMQSYGMGIALLAMGAIICGRGIYGLIRFFKYSR